MKLAARLYSTHSYAFNVNPDRNRSFGVFLQPDVDGLGHSKCNPPSCGTTQNMDWAMGTSGPCNMCIVYKYRKAENI